MLLDELVADLGGLEHDLERVALRRSAEDVVRLLRIREGEAVGGERRRVETPCLDQLEELRRRGRIDETRRDQDVADPQLLEVERAG